MPPSNNPGTTSFHEFNSIQTKSDDRSPSNRRLAYDRGPVRTPVKVVNPNLPPGIKESYNFACIRVSGSDSTALVVVAHRTREPEIFDYGETAKRLRNDVVNLHGCTSNTGGGPTVAAAMPDVLGDLLAQCFRDVATTHRLEANSTRHDHAA